MPSLHPQLQDALSETVSLIQTEIDNFIPLTGNPEDRLYEAMRHAALGGGKRLRPFLCISAANMFGVDPARSRRVAAAIEMVHCYSLVHDDLPAMDDSDLRRGKPTVHKQFDEATAILAGDALLTYAFEIIANNATHDDPNVRAQLVLGLARAVGGNGMVGGQMMDMLAQNTEFDIGQTTRLQRMKTGELIAFSCEAGAILGKATEQQRLSLRKYAHDLGLAFQMIDDVLDVESTPEEMGKPVRKDHAAKKATFVTILGPERTRAQAEMLSAQARRHLEVFESRAQLLRDVAQFVVERRS
jgi:farnesyl diphosphate synthase